MDIAELKQTVDQMLTADKIAAEVAKTLKAERVGRRTILSGRYGQTLAALGTAAVIATAVRAWV